MSQNSEPIENRPIIVYDGVCHLCNGSLNFVVRHQRAKPSFYFVPFQSEEGRYICEHYGIAADDLSTFLYVSGGNVEGRSDAWLTIMAQLAFPYDALARLARIVPKAIRDFIYDSIGKRRYRWFGQSEVCLIPGAEGADAVPDLETVKSIVHIKHENSESETQ